MAKRKKQGGEACSAIGCSNARNKFDCEGLAFFRFPKDEERCRQWVQNSQRLDLIGKTSEQLNKSYLFCRKHFEPNQFLRPDDPRSRLKHDGKPTIFDVPNPPPKALLSGYQHKLHPMADRQCDGMESDDSCTGLEVKIEIDVAEDESLFWNTQVDTQGKTHDCVEDITTDTHHEINTSNPLATDTATDPIKIANCKKWIKTEPDEVLQEFEPEPVDKKERKPNKKSFSCDVCSKTFKCTVYLKEHMLVHTDERCFACRQCSKTFKRGSDLNSHMFVHTDERPFVCDVCSKTFKRLQNLKHHMSSLHIDKKSFSCDLCCKTFNHAYEVKKHMLVHTDEKSFACSECSKTYKRACDLKVHMSAHTGEKPFACDVCRNIFRHASELKQHMLVHTEEKPFVCDVCSKKFRSAFHLKQHRSLHDERPFACDVCSKTFRYARQLKSHMLIHIDEGCFACSKCKETFTYASDLKSHMSVHTDDRPFVCDVSNKTFQLANNLNQKQVCTN